MLQLLVYLIRRTWNNCLQNLNLGEDHLFFISETHVHCVLNLEISIRFSNVQLIAGIYK